MAGVRIAVVPDLEDETSEQVAVSGELDCTRADAVSELYELVGRTAALKAAKIVGRMDVALEIVQEVFLKLWKAQLRFPDRKAAFVWVYRCAHNAAIDHLRLAVNRHDDLDAAPPSALAVLPDASLEARELIMLATGRLNERELQIVVYQLVDGMSQGEIAEVLGVSRKTVVRDWQKIDEKLTALRREFT
jgi:RNA polymerase sigma-70 factor (ECF subfamily)